MYTREASAEDISWIIELENHPDNREFVWQGSESQHLEEIKDPSSYLLIHCKNSGEKVGYSLSVYHESSKNFEVRRIVIEEKGQGYGKKSMLYLMKLAFEKIGAQRLWLDVYPHNKKGIKLYERLGFVQEGHLRRSDFRRGRYYDQLIFSMLLEEYKEKIL